MDLPKSIVKEFAKQAVEKKPTVDKPTQLVGTVQVEDGQTFVYLDGSNGSKTPVSETVAYQSGDRVLVSIQNRKATIIGNYTDPSINQALDNVIIEYALSSSSVSFIAWPGEKGEWNTIAPEKEDGSYMWQRTTKISTNPLINPEISLTCIQGSDGENGYTPYIGSNGNWWINGVDTGYSAEGDDGHSPYVDTTTNTWWEWDADIGNYHDTGIVPQGPGVFKSIVFKRFSSQPNTPTGGSYLSPVPSGWSDGIPSGTEQIWISTRVFTSDGESPQTSEWTTPQMSSDTPDIDFEYSWIVTNPGNPTDNSDNWSNAATENSIWMAVRKKSIGTWSSWEISKIKGEDGEMSAEQIAQLNQASEDASTAKTDASAAKDSVDTLSDKTRSGFIETLSGTGFVQSNKTEDGGTSEVVVYGKSEQIVTEQSANLCPKYDKWTLSGGAYIDGDYIVFPSAGANARVSVHWKKANNYLWFNISAKSDSDEAADLYIGCSNGNGRARPLTKDETTLNFVVGGDGDDYGNNLLNSDYVTFTISHYGTATGSMRIRNFMVSKTYIDTNSNYVPFVPDSPSPEYPSEIQSVENPKVTACGKNLLKHNTTGQTKAGITYTVNKDGSVTLNGTSTAWTFFNLNYIAGERLPRGSYIVSGGNEKARLQILINDAVVANDLGNGATFAVGDNATTTWLRIIIYANQTFENETIYPMIRSTNVEDSGYEPYKGKTATLSDIVLRSIPDGTRDKLFKDTDGLWKVEKKCGIVDLGTLAWTYNSTYAIFLANVNTYPSFPTAGPNNMGMCSKYLVHESVVVPELANYDDTIFICSYNWSAAKWLLVRDTSYTDATTFKSAMSGAMLVYELATSTYETLPDSIQAELNALTTYNPITNVFVSAGVTPDIDVSFWTRDYRAKSMAESIVKRVVIGEDSVDIVDSTGRLLASYGDAKIELGKNAVSSIIEMCGGMARVSARYGGLTALHSNNGSLNTTLDYDFNETTFKSKVGSNYGSYEFIYSGGVWECSYSGNNAGYVQVSLSDYGITLNTTSVNEYAGISINYWDGSEATFINAETSKPSRKLILGLAESGTTDNTDYANFEIERSKESDGEHSKINLLTVHDGANVAGVYLDNGNIELDASGEVLINQYNIVQMLMDMLCCADTESITVTAGTFTDSGCSATLAGNTLYLYLNAKAKAAITAGNIKNQTMLTITFTDNRILALYSVTGSGGSSGPNSQMQFSASSNGGQHTITVTLAAIAQNIAKDGVINAHVSMPCVLNWDAYPY